MGRLFAAGERGAVAARTSDAAGAVARVDRDAATGVGGGALGSGAAPPWTAAALSAAIALLTACVMLAAVGIWLSAAVVICRANI